VCECRKYPKPDIFEGEGSQEMDRARSVREGDDTAYKILLEYTRCIQEDNIKLHHTKYDVD
jgi:hypothetical protein